MTLRACMELSAAVFGVFGSVWEWVWFSWESGCGLLVDWWYVHFLSPWLGMQWSVCECVCVGVWVNLYLSVCHSVSDYLLSPFWFSGQLLFVSVHSPPVVWEKETDCFSGDLTHSPCLQGTLYSCCVMM